ncbi:MAG: PBP1A family penicillin-binding protein [Candidatus Shapirobacteria bacterium]
MKRRRTGSPIALFLQKIGQPFFRLLVWLLEKASQKKPRYLRKKTVIVFPPAKLKFNFKKILVPAFLVGFLFLFFNFYFLILRDLPDPNQLINRQPLLTTKIYDRNGQLLYKIYRSQSRTLIKINELPIHLVQAVVAIEDAEFYRHRGLSLKGIFRAAWKNIREQKLVGGSTITQQLVKNALLTPEKTWSRKIREILLALRVEWQFSKDEIMQMYLNEVGFGGTAYGIEEASWSYFDKPAAKLNLAEAALLAGLPASPTTYSPFGANPELAKQRQEEVLRRMREEKFITKEAEEATKKEEVHFAPQRNEIQAPHYVMYIRELLEQKYGQPMVESGGLEVYTSLDLELQKKVQKIVSEEIGKIEPLKISNGAALVTRPETGEILAMVGSKDYFDLENDGNVNVTTRSRQPGSAIKPINYAVALANGFTAATLLSDTPITYEVAGQPPYSPNNYDDRFHGEVVLRVALASSYNVPAVKVLAALGVNRMIDQGEKMGITTWKERSRFGLSLTLGGGEVKMTDMAVVYGALANLGQKVELNPILEVKNARGQSLEKMTVKKEKVMDERIAYLLTDILADPEARSPAFGIHSWLNIKDFPNVAVKTGTTQNRRDNWTIGYTPDFLTAVWVGNNDNSPMSYVASGITGASPIWNKIMNLILKENRGWPRPEGMEETEICSPTRKKELFLAGTAPKYHCPSPAPSPTQSL